MVTQKVKIMRYRSAYQILKSQHFWKKIQIYEEKSQNFEIKSQHFDFLAH